MNTKDIIVQETSRKDSDLCNCSKCKGQTGTARVCFNSRKLAARALGNAPIKSVGLFLLLAYFLLQGRASADSQQYDKASFGYLKVFSATQESQWGEGSYYYLHTGYRIYDTSGKVVKWVENHNTGIDEDPQKVELAPGAYTIWAQSEKDGYVRVPVVIKLARMTAVHLENNRASN